MAKFQVRSQTEDAEVTADMFQAGGGDAFFFDVQEQEHDPNSWEQESPPRIEQVAYFSTVTSVVKVD